MGSILAIDYGLKRIGLAVSDPNRVFAFPCGAIENKNFDFVLSNIKNIILEKEVDLIIIGMPYDQRSKIGDQKPEKNKMEKLICEFIKKIKNTIDISIEAVDERFSSFIANENLKERGISAKKSRTFVDTEAARILLEEFIRSFKG